MQLRTLLITRLAHREAEDDALVNRQANIIGLRRAFSTIECNKSNCIEDDHPEATDEKKKEARKSIFM